MQTFSLFVNSLQDAVCDANFSFYKTGIIPLTFGNVSQKSSFDGLDYFAIKPSGVDYEKIKSKDIVVMDLKGNIIKGFLRPSSDTPTHLYLYMHLKYISGIAHSHSIYATSWAQSGNCIPVLGTTHADYSAIPILCTRELDQKEIIKDYELNTGKVIVEEIKRNETTKINMILVRNHGSFCFGSDGVEAVENSIALENIAKLAYLTLQINQNTKSVPSDLINAHYNRKNGIYKYYGQD
jgi:L-ribulose-5-phosphate 4-epimerase